MHKQISVPQHTLVRSSTLQSTVVRTIAYLVREAAAVEMTLVPSPSSSCSVQGGAISPAPPPRTADPAALRAPLARHHELDLGGRTRASLGDVRPHKGGTLERGEGAIKMFKMPFVFESRRMDHFSLPCAPLC